MTGAEALFQYYARVGIRVCFANPGTTELALVGALERRPEIRTYLGLFEGVLTGAADGYGRMTRLPALTILHLGPGFANGIANLHNARRANTGIINIVGDHATWHVAADPPLTSDVLGMTTAASDWVGRVESIDQLSELAQTAHLMALAGQVATIVFPADLQAAVVRPFGSGREARPHGPIGGTEAAAAALGAGSAALYLGGAALVGEALVSAGRIAAVTGCRLIAETFPPRLERGVGRPAVERLPYFPEQARAALEGLSDLIVLGAKAPVAFFGYEGVPSSVVPDGVAVHTFETLDAGTGAPDLADFLGRLAVEAGAGESHEAVVEPSELPAAGGLLTPSTLGATLAAHQPEGAIVVDEANTSGLPYFSSSHRAPAFDHVMLTGGSLGFGLPAALGAAIACPTRPVIAFQADGAAMYTLQALWTMQRHVLDVTVVIAANRLYRILRVEAGRTGVETGPVAASLTDLKGLNWVALATGHGVPAESVNDTAGLSLALTKAFDEPGPHLIEAVLT